jgi:hypothetical protein
MATLFRQWPDLDADEMRELRQLWDECVGRSKRRNRAREDLAAWRAGFSRSGRRGSNPRHLAWESESRLSDERRSRWTAVDVAVGFAP